MNETDLSREKLKGAQRVFFGILLIDIVACAIVALNAFATVGTLRDIDAGRAVANQAMLSSLEFSENLSRLTIVTHFGVGIGLVKWLNACYSYARTTIGASGVSNERWTAAGWLVPVFNLFKPYQVISEIYRIGSPNQDTPESWKQEGGSGALLVWWIFWTITHLAMVMFFNVLTSSKFGEVANLHNAIFATQTQAFFCITSMLIAGSWFWVGNLLTRRLLECRTAFANSSSSQMKPQPPLPATKPFQSAPTRVSEQMSMEARKVIIPTNSSPSQRENLHSMSNIDEDAIYEMIGQEIKEGRTETGLWTRLFAEMDGDETKIKVAYIKRRAEKMIATEHARFQKQLLIQEEEQKAVRIAEVELQNVAESFGVTTAQAKVMLEFGIVKDGDQFSFKGYRYDRLSDALNYAKMNSKGARQAQDTRTKETIHRDLLISAANSVRRNPNLRNSLALLKLNGDNVSFHSQGFFYSKYLMKRDGKTVVTDEPGVIRYAQELAQEFS